MGLTSYQQDELPKYTAGRVSVKSNIRLTYLLRGNAHAVPVEPAVAAVAVEHHDAPLLPLAGAPAGPAAHAVHAFLLTPRRPRKQQARSTGDDDVTTGTTKYKRKKMKKRAFSLRSLAESAEGWQAGTPCMQRDSWESPKRLALPCLFNNTSAATYHTSSRCAQNGPPPPPLSARPSRRTALSPALARPSHAPHITSHHTYIHTCIHTQHATHLVRGPPILPRLRSLGENHRALPLSPVRDSSAI